MDFEFRMSEDLLASGADIHMTKPIYLKVLQEILMKAQVISRWVSAVGFQSAESIHYYA